MKQPDIIETQKKQDLTLHSHSLYFKIAWVIIAFLGVSGVFIFTKYLTAVESLNNIKKNADSIELEISELANDKVNIYLNELSNAIIAFNTDTCPDGWLIYPEAQGRFLRGIDKSQRSIDPDGLRPKGSIQEDMFKSHNHEITKQQPLVHKSHGGGPGEDLDPGGWAAHTTLTIDNRGGEETRPKNVAVMFCVKE